MKRAATVLLMLAVSLGLLVPEQAQADFDGLPGTLADTLVVGGLGAPNAFDWLPDGDILIASQSGIVHRWDGAARTTVLNISGVVCSPAGSEMGLLGLAIDPDFGSGLEFVYLYYTHKRGNGDCLDHRDRANRVSRFTVGANGSLSNERVLVDNIPAFAGNHNGGDLHFGNDELLYISVGDSGADLQTGGGNNGNARRLDLLNGKILRITREGPAAPNNPFFGNGVSCRANGMAPGAPATAFNAPQENAEERKKQRKKKRHKKKRHKKKGHGKKGKKNNKNNNKNRKRNRRDRRRNDNQGPQPTASAALCREIFATGLRNPFRFAFDPDSNADPQRFYINDVGGGAWEEIDDGAAGAPPLDFGWNVREGPCVVGSTTNCPPDNRFEDPVFAYSRQGLPTADFNGCNIVTGGAFVPDDPIVPDEFNDGDYLFADLGCEKIFALEDDGTTVSIFATANGGGGAVHLAFGPDGALYYTTFQGGGQLRRIGCPSPSIAVA